MFQGTGDQVIGLSRRAFQVWGGLALNTLLGPFPLNLASSQLKLSRQLRSQFCQKLARCKQKFQFCLFWLPFTTIWN